MQIGSHEIGGGAVLAPMAGITNPPFRMLCREMGASLTVTELISAFALEYLTIKPGNRERRLGRDTLALIERFPGESPLAVQIFGRDPERMAVAAQVAVAEGADIIDLNFGCPAKKVAKGGEGSGVALMRTPDLLVEIARRVVDAVDVPVTAKTRTGWSKDTINAPEIARRLEGVGIQMLCIHGRSRDQVHSGDVDLETIAEVVQAVNIPVIGNGGIRTREDAHVMTERTGCARVAVGQGARGNPWIFSDIKGEHHEPSLAERVATCRRHLEHYVQWVGEDRAARDMRKHACWYLKGFSGAAAFRKRLGEADNLPGFLNLLDEIDVT